MAQPIEDAQATSTNSLPYDRLRSWYLASLRRSIVQQMESQQMTPSALIAADRMAVERLVSSATAPTTKAEEKAAGPFGGSQRLLKVIALLLPLAAIAPAVIMCLTAQSFHLVNMLAALLGGSLVAMGGLALTLDYCYDKPLMLLLAQILPANTKGTKAASGSSPDTQASQALTAGKQPLCELKALVDDLETKLALSQERERAIVDYALDFICAFDRSGIFAAVGPSSASFCGYVPTELFGKSIIDMVSAEDKERTHKFLQAIKKSSAPVPFEHRIKKKDGQLIDVRWLAEWSEREQCLFCVGKNVSAERRLERLRKEFVSMVSHDLRTPLTSVELSVQLLREQLAPDKESESESTLTSIGESIKRLLVLIHELLDLEKMESGKLPMKIQSKPLVPVIERSLAAVQGFAQFKNVKVNLERSEHMVAIDEDRLEQVIVNLLSNAIKFSPAGKQIEISCQSTNRASVRVTIADQGPGIAAHQHETIFERFAQAREEDRKLGSGLGLSICKVIIDSHGGTIGLDSEPGQGSSFWFEIPTASQADST